MIILGFDKSDVRLIFNMWRMTLADRYLGSALGGAWALLNPLLLFALFTFVFGFYFKPVFQALIQPWTILFG